MANILSAFHSPVYASGIIKRITLTQNALLGETLEFSSGIEPETVEYVRGCEVSIQ